LQRSVVRRPSSIARRPMDLGNVEGQINVMNTSISCCGPPHSAKRHSRLNVFCFFYSSVAFPRRLECPTLKRQHGVATL
jgi:hypothetical protein